MIIYNEFNSLKEWAQAITRAPKIDGSGSSSMRRSNEFHRNMDYGTCINICLRLGGLWPEGARMLMESSAKIEKSLPSSRPANRRDYAGSRPHIQAHLSGSHRSMVRSKPIGRPLGAIKIGVNMIVASNVPENFLVNRGAAILSLIKKLEANGQKVELFFYLSLESSFEDIKVCDRVTLKHPNEKLYISDLSYSLLHPTITRRLFFARLERIKEFKKDTNAGYGKPIDYFNTKKEERLIFESIKHNDKWANSPETAMKHIDKLYRSFNDAD